MPRVVRRDFDGLRMRVRGARETYDIRHVFRDLSCARLAAVPASPTREYARALRGHGQTMGMTLLGRACAALAIWFMSVLPVDAQSSGLADRLIDAYSKLSSYCDEARRSLGKVGDPLADAPETLTHCMLQDGRYKVTVRGGNGI